MALSSPIDPFIWGAGGAQLTPEQIARQREIAAALLNQAGDTSPVADWTQGAARVVNALGGVLKERRANKAEAANAEGSQSRIAALLGGMSGGGAAQFPAAPGAGGDPVAAATMPQSAEAGVIRQGLIDRGLPSHVADAFVMNMQDESGLNPGINEQNPTVPGSRGGYGLYQLTGPRRRAYEAFAGQRGVDPSDTNAQLDFLMSELRGPEAKAAQSIMAAPDTGTAAAAIVNNFLRPAEANRAKRASQYLAYKGEPVQVASNDPAIGLGVPYDPSQPYDAAADARAKNAAQQVIGNDPAASSDGGYVPGAPAATTPAGQRVVQALINPQSMTGGAPMPMQGAAQSGGAPQGAGSPGEIRRGADGKTYQYAETTGMAGATGANGWMPVNVDASSPPVSQGASQDLSSLSPMAGGTAGASPAGAAGGGFNPGMQAAIAQALSSPYASDGEKQIAGILLKQQMAQSDPANALDMRYKQAQIDALQGKSTQVPEAVRALNMRAEQAGLKPGTPEYQNFMVTGGRGPQTVINTGENTSKFVQKSDEAAAKRMDEIVSAGQTAPQTMADMQQLIDLGSKIGTGQAAQVKGFLGPYAQSLGIDIQGLDDIQAYQAITSRLAPQMRAVGSGSSSDRDVALFFQSLPNLRNTQGGNELIANTMKSVAQNKMNAAEIASKAQRGEISWQDADKQIRELPNPYELFKKFQGETEKKKTVIDGYTIERAD